MAVLSLEGRGAVVTGAGRGIGRAIAWRLAAEGASVCVNDVDAAAAEETVAAVVASGATAIAVAGSVALPQEAARVMETAASELGGLHILVNNAGLTRDAMVHRMTDEEWDTVVDVVLRGAFNCIRAVAPWFREAPPSEGPDERPYRKIVNVASVAGVYGSPGNANYAAAKAGLIGLTRSVAKEWARFRVNVNAVAPGFVETRLTAARTGKDERFGIPSEVREAIVSRIPLGRPGRPEDVAGAVAFFCSPDSDYITGQVLEVHGGLGDISVVG